MKAKTKDLRLIEWANDNYPPIDLNKDAGDVIHLIKEVKRLRAENTALELSESIHKGLWEDSENRFSKAKWMIVYLIAGIIGFIISYL